MASTSQNLQQLIIHGDRVAVADCVQFLLDDGLKAHQILQAMSAAMDEVGRLYQDQEYFIPDLLISAQSMKLALAVLEPQLKQGGIEPIGIVVAGTVRGDLHDMGKNLVCMMLEGAGFQVFDLGVDVSPERFAEGARQHNAQLLVLSALLTSTMMYMKDTVDAIHSNGLTGSVKVLVGGAPVTQAFCEQIRADGYAPDAAGAVQLAKSFVHPTAPLS